MIFKSFHASTIKVLKNGGVGVIPTDTIYGIVGSAFNKKTVERIYKLRQRNLKKPMIVLFGQISDLKKFGIPLKTKNYNLESETWPSKTSIVFSAPGAKFRYLHRGGKTLAFRLPKLKKLREFLKKTGPLVAPSANRQGEPTAKTIRQAQKYFGSQVNFYIDVGKLSSKPSRLIRITRSGSRVEYPRK
ncbi:MAG: tRNA threonylcarbamoyladenosine biosynthesis protein [Parcubacteria group bacterium Gr01-1014_20]|nr:MAG: tRNA threonylcarbamoyladenosine biosynthesis protein [Parcubacteria group bacterium Gr01-1014_20]